MAQRRFRSANRLRYKSADLPAETARAIINLPIDNRRPSDPRAEKNAEHMTASLSRAQFVFRVNARLHIITDRHLHLDHVPHVLSDGEILQYRQIRRDLDGGTFVIY